MINLKDTTFIIPLMIDSQDRLENANHVVRHLQKYLDTNIFIVEQEAHIINRHEMDWFDLNWFSTLSENVFYFETDVRSDGNTWRTKQANYAFGFVTTPYISIYDADVLLKPQQYEKSIELLRNNKADVVYPFNNNYLNIGKEYKKELIMMDFYSKIHIDESWIRWKGHSLGGAYFITSDKFKESGMENENFTGYGKEDRERFLRYSKLGYRITQIPGDIYHMEHISTPTSKGKDWRHAPHYIKNVQEYKKIESMTTQQLKGYIKNGGLLVSNSI